ncbi:fasciclin domain-containing protein [Ferruginibacter sp.]
MKSKIFTAILIAPALACLFSSCKKNDTVTQSNDAVSAISGDPSLTIFSSIINRSGDGSYVNSSGTIVAPVDSAFINAGITSAIAATLNPAACDSIVKYYSFANSINFSGSSNTETPFDTELGSAFFADSTGSQLFFEGAAAISATPAMAGTAYLYKITRFVNPPAPSITQLSVTDTSISLFNEAFARTNFASVLSSGSYTLLIPTNAAFMQAGYPDIASIDAADINTLTQLLMYQTLPGRMFNNDLDQQSSVITLQGEPIQLNDSNGTLQLTGNNSSTATLVSNGELVGNDVETFKINSLLLP